MSLISFLKYNEFPYMIMSPDEGDAGAGGGDAGGDPAGGADNGGEGQGAGEGEGDAGAGGDAGDKDPAGGDKGTEGDPKAVDKNNPQDKQGDPKAVDKKDGGKGKDAGKPTLWDEKWREAYAGEDSAKLNMLKRFSSPKDVIDALISAQQKIRSGEAKQPLAKDATPEQIAAFRKENGIPENPEGYLEKLPDGVTLGDEDKEGAAAFLKEAHESNLPPAVVSMALKAYVERQQAFTEQRQQADIAQREECINLLRDAYGPEYQANINIMNNFVKSTFPEDRQDAILSARLGDGTAMFNDPAVLQAFVKIARDVNPVGIPMPGQGFDRVESVNARIKEIETMMSKDPNSYYKNEAIQKEARDLYAARERFGSK